LIFVALEGLQEVELRLREYGDAQVRFSARLASLRDIYRHREGKQPEVARELVAIRQALEKLAQAMPVLQARKIQLAEALRKGLNRKGLQITVEKVVHAGVTIKAGGEQLRLSDTLQGPRRFVFDEGRIKVF
jgi:aspartate aminotransferase-like enzyme